MKLANTTFEEYLHCNKETPLHPKLVSLYNKFPPDLIDLRNIIFYGPKGVGKYTQALSAIKRYSPTNLKYEKKLSLTYNKNIYFFKISDVHFEIDMSLLGCNTKLLWNEFYNTIMDVLLAKTDRRGIILCKNFHDTHTELLEIFYSYMQTEMCKWVDIKFILITQSISFIPDNILKSCHTISIPRPSRKQYNKCLSKNIPPSVRLCDIDNIKELDCEQVKSLLPYDEVCSKIIHSIINYKEVSFIQLRDDLYDILIYDLNVNECVWRIIDNLIRNDHLKYDMVNDVLIKTYTTLQYYNNNYRPIYHLEGFVFNLINTLHGLNKGI